MTAFVPSFLRVCNDSYNRDCFKAADTNCNWQTPVRSTAHWTSKRLKIVFHIYHIRLSCIWLIIWCLSIELLCKKQFLWVQIVLKKYLLLQEIFLKYVVSLCLKDNSLLSTCIFTIINIISLIYNVYYKIWVLFFFLFVNVCTIACYITLASNNYKLYCNTDAMCFNRAAEGMTVILTSFFSDCHNQSLCFFLLNFSLFQKVVRTHWWIFCCFFLSAHVFDVVKKSVCGSVC